MLRSAFGLVFRKVTFPFNNRQCRECLLRQNCVWSYIFDTPRPRTAGILPEAETVPHTFVIEPPDNEAMVLKKESR